MSSRRDEIVQAALLLLDESGLDNVSLRGVATRLGIRLNTVSWHVKTKARLMDLLADRILAEASLDGLPDNWDERARELLCRYRQAMLAHRDAGRVIAGTFPTEPATLRFGEELLSTLLGSGMDKQTAAWTYWSLTYFTIGLVQEEQGNPDELFERVTAQVDPALYPTLVATMRYIAEPKFDERFLFGIDLLLRSGSGHS